ncbi:MAG: glycosyltransferase family 4 protein [Bacteroidales bacterium]|nr:glycosyltransferase family 4 protein [Bacteroidales bacterium]
MRIVYDIAGTYRAAGMEKVLAEKASYLAGLGHEVTIITTDQHGRKPAFDMDPTIKTINLGINYEEDNGSLASKLLQFPLRQVRHKKRLAKALDAIRPDVTVSMFCNDETFLPSIKDGSKKVLEVHFSRFKRLQYGRKGLWALTDRYRSWSDLRHIRKFDRFVVLTEEDKGYWGNLDNITVIPNPIMGISPEPSSLDSRTILAAGRLCHQKGFERLIEAWSIVREKSPAAKDWKVRIAGEGEDRGMLEKMIEDHGLGDSVTLAGSVMDMDKEYMNSSVLAMTSRYEGLPMVLLEAEAHGVPAVSFACKCGPKDVITDGVNGLLVPEDDVEAFAEALCKVIEDTGLLKSMGAAAYRDAARWDMETIMKKWTDLFENI